jgi:hypothetical protein
VPKATASDSFFTIRLADTSWILKNICNSDVTEYFDQRRFKISLVALRATPAFFSDAAAQTLGRIPDIN